ncbi:MAG: hypothetical protein R3F33_13925 [Planctomycetota bacterium]
MRHEFLQGMQQRLVLQPRMLQSVEILQLAAQDLWGYLADKALVNEAISLDSVQRPESDFEAPRMAAGGREASDAHLRVLHSQPGRPLSGPEVLLAQVAAAGLPADDEHWLAWLVGQLDRAGYLSQSDEVLLTAAERAGLDGGLPRLAAAIAHLQGLEPAGIGGRDLIECLLLQLDPTEPDYPELCELIEHHLDAVARNKWPRVAKAMGLDVAAVRALVQRLAQLDPRPLESLDCLQAPVLRPEMAVWLDAEGALRLRMDRSLFPEVCIDEDVRRLARTPRSPNRCARICGASWRRPGPWATRCASARRP